MKDSRAERIAFIAIREGAKSGAEDALIFGSVTFSWVDVNDAGLIESSAYDNEKENKAEFWVLRRLPLAELRNILSDGASLEKSRQLLWDDDISLSDLRNPSSDKQAALRTFFGELDDELLSDEIAINKLSSTPGAPEPDAFYKKFQRILFFSYAKESGDDTGTPLLVLDTANPSKADSRDLHTHLGFKRRLIETGDGQLFSPFVGTYMGRLYVRAVANAHPEAANPDQETSLLNGMAFFEHALAGQSMFFRPLGAPFSDLSVPRFQNRDETGRLTFYMTEGLLSATGNDQLENWRRSPRYRSWLHVVAGLVSSDARHNLFKNFVGAYRVRAGKPVAFSALGISHAHPPEGNFARAFGVRPVGQIGDDARGLKLIARFEYRFRLGNEKWLPGRTGLQAGRELLFSQEQPQEQVRHADWEDLLAVPKCADWRVALSGFDNRILPLEDPQSFAEQWSGVMVPAVTEAIKRIRPDRAFSFLPLISSSQQDPSWTLLGELHDKNPSSRNVEPGEVDEALVGRWSTWMPFARPQTLSDPRSLGNYSVAQLTSPVAASFALLRKHDGSIVAPADLKDAELITAGEAAGGLSDVEEPVDAWQPRLDEARFAVPAFRLTIRFTRDVQPGPEFVRLGAMDLDFAAPGEQAKTVLEGYWDILFTPPTEAAGGDLADAFPRRQQNRRHQPVFNQTMRMALAGAEVVAEDSREIDPTELEDIRRTGALWREPADSTIFLTPWPNAGTPHVLVAQETLSDDVGHTLSLSLRAVRTLEPDNETGPGADSRDQAHTIAVSRAPFFVVATSKLHLPATSDSADNEVAVWREEGGAGRWLVRTPEQRATMLLPPQALGEAMEKIRGKTTPGDEDGYELNDIAENELVDYRLGPITTFDVDTSPLDSVFAEPALNVLRLLTEPRGIASGIGVYEISFELLYGLFGHLRPKSPIVGFPPLRLAERRALNGRPAPLLGGDGRPEYIERWHQIRLGLESRLAVFDLWRSDQLVPEAGRINQDLSYTLRNKADLRYPVPPKIASDDLITPEPPFRYSKDALAGGVGWAFESANITDAVWRDPVSTGASAERLRFSALGGWGHQRAEFDGGRTVIETEVAMGRVHRYQLERIGRVGCLWNRAKHVIVYERTVVPSAQFFNDDGRIGKTQDLLEGRPVLRKVDEYVECLESVRRFPEDPAASTPQHVGFLAGATCRSQRIRVDSRWGRDVGKDGWEVPLWRAEFGENAGDSKDPRSIAALYPKPQFELICIDASGTEACLEIDDPEKLRFFTSTRPEDDSETDSWPSFRLVDYPDWKEPSIPSSETHPIVPTDAQLTAPSPEPIGWGRFTVRVVRRGARIAIAHGRVPQGPSAVLSTVTIARSTVPSQGPQSNTTTEAIAGIESLENSIELFRDSLSVTRANLQVPGSLSNSRLVEDVRMRITELQNFVGQLNHQKDEINKHLETIKKFETDFDPCKPIRERVQREVQNKADRIESELNNVLVRINEDVDRSHLLVKTQVRDAIAAADATHLSNLKSRALGEVDRIRASLAGLTDQILLQIDNATQLGFGDDMLGQLEKVLKPVEDVKLADELGGADAFKPLVDELIAKIDDGATTLQEFKDLYNAKKDTARDKIDAAILKLETIPHLRVLLNLARGLKRTLESLNSTITDLSGWSAADKAKLKATLVGIRGKLLRIVQGFDAAKSDVVERIKLLLNEIYTIARVVSGDGSDYTSGIVRRLQIAADRLLEEAGKNIAAVDLSNAQFELNKARGQLRAAVESALGQLDEVVGEWKEQTTSYRQSLSQAIAQIKTELDAILDAYCMSTFGQAADYADGILEQIKGFDLAGALEQRFPETVKEVGEFIELVEDSFDSWRERLDNAAADIRTVADGLQERVESLAEQGRDLQQQGSNLIRLVRAVGDPPETDALGFNRPETAYVFDVLEGQGIEITPVVAGVNRGIAQARAAGQAAEAAQDLLASFGVNIPVRNLGEQLLPDELDKFDVNRILPDMSGIELAGLLKDFKFPKLPRGTSNAVKVRHGFDREERVAWLDADVNVPLGKPAQLLALGPVDLTLTGAELTAEARLRAAADGSLTQQSEGKISGNFVLDVAGYKIIQFRETRLTFDKTGKFEFDVNARNVELADALKLLVDLLQSAGQEAGLEIVPIEEGGQTTGIATEIDAALPNLEAGAFGISGLAFHSAFALRFAPEFDIGIDLSLGKRTAPFSMMIAFLTGGGYFVSSTRYLPAKGRLTQELAIAITVGAGAGLNLVIASGNIHVAAGIELNFVYRSRGGGNIEVALFLVMNGSIVALGIIRINLGLRLELRYAGSTLFCNGYIRGEAKLGPFTTIKVNQAFTYRLAGSPSSGYGDSYT